MEDESKYLYDYLNYDYLKTEAINYIKKVGYNKWNYFGENDPGITILENLIFALIDLDYRISFPVADILTVNPNKKKELKNYYLPDEILPMNPVCLDDYYRVILDVDGVINCKILPIKDENLVVGCYNIYLYVEHNDDLEVNEVKKAVIKTLYERRNLCEDFDKIDFFDIIDVYVEAEIEPNTKFINNTNSYEDLVSTLLADIQDFFVPKIKFSTLSELFDRKLQLSEIYDGPLLKHGFITDKDLEENKIKNKIFIIDIIERILKNNNVVNVISFKLSDSKTKEQYLTYIKLDENQAVRLNFQGSTIKIRVNDINVKINKPRCLMLAKRRYLFLIKNTAINDEEIGIYEGQYRNFLEYTSLQNDFPLIYDIGQNNIDNNKLDDKNINSHQLKCFLLLFDQVFFLYQIVLENLKTYFSIDIDEKNIINDKLPRDIPSLKSLIKHPCCYSLDSNNVNMEFCVQRKYLIDVEIINNYNNILKSCDDYIKSLVVKSNIISRKDTLNFLVKLFSNYDNIKNNNVSLTSENKQKYISCCAELEKERGKAFELYKHIPWEGSNISGLEKKICVCWNIKNFNRRFLYRIFEESFQQWDNLNPINETNKSNNKLEFVYKSKYKNIIDLVLYYGNDPNNYVITKKKSYVIRNLKEIEENVLEIRILINGENDKFISIVNEDYDFTDHELVKRIIDKSLRKINKFNEESEGFHLIENILLRPNDNKVGDSDPYSCRLTLVFPNWTERFQKKEFRTSIEKWIESVSPAHLKIDFLWLSFEDLKKFETMYKNWYDKKNNLETPRKELDKINLDFILMINQFNIKYKNRNICSKEDLIEYNTFSDPIA